MKKRVFITGEAGMTAQALEKVLEKDYDVVWGYNHRDKNVCSFRSIYNDNMYELDITDYATLEREIQKSIPDIIVHLGAIVGTDMCLRYPKLAIDSNIKGTYNIVKIAAEFDCKLVYFSTTAIYDINNYGRNNPITEDTSKKPKTLYGITKYSGELICNSVMNPEKLLIIRPCFVFGGKEDHHSALSKIVNAAKLDKQEIVLMNLNNYKDYLYLDDEIAAIKFLIDNDAEGDYNVSRGTPLKLYMYVGIISSILGKVPNVKYVPQKDYLHNHIVSNKKISSLGWFPRISIEEGIKSLL